jgi:hypothetical protein
VQQFVVLLAFKRPRRRSRPAVVRVLSLKPPAAYISSRHHRALSQHGLHRQRGFQRLVFITSHKPQRPYIALILVVDLPAAGTTTPNSAEGSTAATGEAMGMKLQGVGGGGTGDPLTLQGFAGSHTRPARPPEAKLRRTAGGLHFLGGELR